MNGKKGEKQMKEDNINILITSVGRRTQLLKYFKKELNGIGNLVATDCSNLAPALYISDAYYIVPRIDDPSYIDSIVDICKREKITAILSLIDPELSLLAKYAEEFKEIGVTTIVSPYEVCELWLDKYATATFCQENEFKFPKTYKNFSDFENDLENKEIDFPVFIKPQKGSASLNINKARNMEQAKVIFESSEDMIIQEFLDGQELGIDVYVDMISKEVVSIFIKEKTVMRAGETDKGKSIKSETLFKIIKDLVTRAGLVGPIDIDVFDVDGEYYISEINPRFGGGYPLAYECGANFPKYIINNLKGIANASEIGNYEENVYMLKHDTLMIKTNL
jgi:carbamoyl-phosphate synthase large subunit